jgi:histidyl-tRNA synthetase
VYLKFSRLAREGINQLNVIANNLSIMDLKFQVMLSTSFVLPIISNPYEYSGFVFQLLVRCKNNINEYDILASGGRYDNMVDILNYFQNFF